MIDKRIFNIMQKMRDSFDVDYKNSYTRDVRDVRIKIDAPEYIKGIIYAVQGSQVLDKYTLTVLYDAVDSFVIDKDIINSDNLSDTLYEISSSLIPVYTHELLEWLCNCPHSDEYVDDVLSEIDKSRLHNLSDLLMEGYFRFAMDIIATLWREVKQYVQKIDGGMMK